jgi:hypothetical protein
MDLVELGARSMILVDLEFWELGCLAGKNWSEAIFLNLELLGALPNTPLGFVSNQGISAEKFSPFVSYLIWLQ